MRIKADQWPKGIVHETDGGNKGRQFKYVLL